MDTHSLGLGPDGFAAARAVPRNRPGRSPQAFTMSLGTSPSARPRSADDRHPASPGDARLVRVAALLRDHGPEPVAPAARRGAEPIARAKGPGPPGDPGSHVHPPAPRSGLHPHAPPGVPGPGEERLEADPPPVSNWMPRAEPQERPRGHA